MERAEIERAIGEVARQHNLLLSPDDPLLVTITLNEVILQRIIARQLQAIEAAQDQIAAGSAQQIETARQIAGIVVTGAADYVAGELKATAAALKADWLVAVEAEKKRILQAAAEARQAQRLAWQAALAIGALLCLLIGAVIGFALDLSGSAPAVQTNAAAGR
jgi:hypothetical protein